jgi:hypothetical protein
LVVSPSSGPVGTKVIVEGSNCNNRGSASTSTDLVFQSGQDGTVGAVGFGQIPNDSQGRFRTTVTIPARMDPLQDVGGGPTRPGTYQFTTRPPICNAIFTVTSTAPNPPTHRGPYPSPAPTPACSSPSAAGWWWPGQAWSCSSGATPSSPPRRQADPELAARPRAARRRPGCSLVSGESAAALAAARDLPRSSNSGFAVQRRSQASGTWPLPAQPLAADRRDPPVLLSLLLSAVDQKVVDQLH